jgi:uncharacterized membrane protein YdbT with pleckstrin-like domain
VLIKTGIIHRQTLEMFISKIESVGVDQGFFARMFDYGSVLVRGTGGFEQAFEAIAAPLEFRKVGAAPSKRRTDRASLTALALPARP